MYEEILRAFLQNARQQGGIGRTGGVPDPNGSSSNMPMVGGTMGGTAPAPMPPGLPQMPENTVPAPMTLSEQPNLDAERPQFIPQAMGGLATMQAEQPQAPQFNAMGGLARPQPTLAKPQPVKPAFQSPLFTMGAGGMYGGR